MMQAFLFLCGERTETMIQIFGKPKCFDTRKAERYFKERRIPYQLVDVTKKGISPGEYRRIRAAVGGLQALLDEKSAAYASCFIAYLALESQVEEKLLEHPELLKTPVVCCGRRAAVGYQPELWQAWMQEEAGSSAGKTRGAGRK